MKSNEEFIQSTLNKLKNNIDKFLIDSNYSSVEGVYLRQRLENYENKIKNFEIIKIQEKIKRIENTKQLNNESLLPNILNIKNNYYPNQAIFNTNKTSSNILYGFQDLNKITVKSSLKSELSEYCTTRNKFRNKTTSGEKRRLNYDKIQKYSNESRNLKYHHDKAIDKFNNTIISQKDINQGLYNMIEKGLIPKNADVSPAMNMGGNPFNINSKVLHTYYKKTAAKDEIANGPLNKLKFGQKYSKNELYFSHYSTPPPKEDNFFLTANIKNNFMQNKDASKTIASNPTTCNFANTKNTFYSNKPFYETYNSRSVVSMNIPNLKKVNKTTTSASNKEKEKLSLFDYINIEDTEGINIIIKFVNYKLDYNNNIDEFLNSHKNIKKNIENIFENLALLFKKLNMKEVFVDSFKILKLLEFYKNKNNLITNKGLLMCLNKDDKNGYDIKNEQYLYKKIKEIFIIKIQKMIRNKISYNKRLLLKKERDSSTKINNSIRRHLILKNMKKLLEEKRNKDKETYNKNQENFKSNWGNIKELTRIEIHINSLSFNEYQNCLIHDYHLKSNLQLNRLMKLADPNVEIIYITPYKINDEILNYYYSILETLGITNIENRVHFFIPEASLYLPCNFSLSSLLYFSNRTLLKIKKLCCDRYCYIMPGIINSDICYEEKIATYLEIPIFMGDKKSIDSLFNKSGIKNILEINDIEFPISAWDIKTDEELYSSLSHLIAVYNNIKIWIFKLNINNFHSKGIAFINIENIDFINNLINEKKYNKNFTVEIFQEKLYYQIKTILNKYIQFSYPNLYHNFNEFLKDFLHFKGIIECCPTKALDGIISNPCIPFLIEPNGQIKLLPTYDKINIDNFKHIVSVSPQNIIKNNELENTANKVGAFLYNQNIIGYITIECITFHNSKKILYWVVDVKYGLTQTICDLQFSYFLYIQSQNLLNQSSRNSEQINNEERNKKLISSCQVFSIPYIANDILKHIKIKDFLREYRYNNIVFNMEKKEGIIFNFSDTLQCGIFGICGLINLDNNFLDDIDDAFLDINSLRLVEKCLNILKSIFFTFNKKLVVDNITQNLYIDERNDKIDFYYIQNRIKNVIKNKNNEYEKSKQLKKKIK